VGRFAGANRIVWRAVRLAHRGGAPWARGGTTDRGHRPAKTRSALPAERALLNVREDAVQLVEAVVTHDQFAFATGRMLDGDLRAELVSEFLLEQLDVRVAAVRAFRG
jgi:hypothetical protein